MKKQKTATYQMTMAQLEARDKKTREEARREAFELMISIPLLVLRDKWGFGSERLERFIDQMFEIYSSIERKDVDFQDLMEVLERETKIKFRRTK